MCANKQHIALEQCDVMCVCVYDTSASECLKRWEIM